MPDKRTAMELREESRRCREEAAGAVDRNIKLMLARRALEFAQLAEAAERESDPSPRRGR